MKVAGHHWIATHEHRLRKDDGDKRRKGHPEAEKKLPTKTLLRTLTAKPSSAHHNRMRALLTLADSSSLPAVSLVVVHTDGCAVSASGLQTADAAKLAGLSASMDSLGMEAALMSRPLPVLPPLLRRVPCVLYLDLLQFFILFSPSCTSDTYLRLCSRAPHM